MNIKIDLISDHILGLLQSSSICVVHSIFENGINIDINRTLVFFGNRQGPSSIKIDMGALDVIKQMPVGSILDIEFPRIYSIEYGISFNFNDAEIRKYKLDPINIPKQYFNSFENYILGMKVNTGFDSSIVDLHNELKNQNDLVEYLLGRGRGLTPSGDDCLVGMLSCHFIQPYLSEDFFEKLEKAILKNKTTHVSRTYLDLASKGLFSIEVLELWKAISNNRGILAAIYNLMAFGQTSGIDTLSGIFFGIQYIKENKKYE